MTEIFDQIRRALRSIWRYRWYAMLVAWLICIFGWAMVYRLPDVYEAAARVHVDTQSMLKPLLKGLAVNTNANQRVDLMTRTLLSRPNMEKLARMVDLDLMAKTPEEMENLLDGLQKRIKITSTGRENLYTISYSNNDRQRAKRVVQSLLTLFVEGTLGDTREDTDVAQHFLLQQIAEYEAKLVAAEERLAEFKRKHVGMMPDEGRDYYARLQAALGNLEQAKLTLREARNRRDALKRQLEGEEVADYSLAMPDMDSPLAARIQNLQQRLDELLLKYTDAHPDVIELRRTIEELDKQRMEELEITDQAGGGELSSNPVYQQLRMVLWETEAQIAAMEVRVGEFQARVNALQEMVDTIPQIEAELAQLNRDYAVNKANYEKLLSRRESAKISERAEITGDDLKFRVVDPPRVPLTPAGPDRPMLFSLVLLGAIGAGAALGLVLNQIRPTFDDTRMLKESTGLPILGVVSRLRTPEYTRRRRLAFMSIGLAGLALLVVYGGILATQLVGMDVLSRLSPVVGSVM